MYTLFHIFFEALFLIIIILLKMCFIANHKMSSRTTIGVTRGG